MADPADQAQDHIEREQASMLAQRKPTTRAFANGRCWCCDAIVGPGMRWCDALCRDDYEKDHP